MSLTCVLGLVAALYFLLGCEDPLECPPVWEKEDAVIPPCVPPAAHVADVEERITTGFYGYANVLHYVPTDEDIELCEPRELARNTDVPVTEYTPGAPDDDVTFLIRTDEDGLFEFNADFTKEYTIGESPRMQPEYGGPTLAGVGVTGEDC